MNDFLKDAKQSLSGAYSEDGIQQVRGAVEYIIRYLEEAERKTAPDGKRRPIPTTEASHES